MAYGGLNRPKSEMNKKKNNNNNDNPIKWRPKVSVSLYIDWSSSVCPVLGFKATFPFGANRQFHVDNSLLV